MYRIGEMSQWIKALAAVPDNLRFLNFHMVEGKPTPTSCPRPSTVHTCMPTHNKYEVLVLFKAILPTCTQVGDSSIDNRLTYGIFL